MCTIQKNDFYFIFTYSFSVPTPVFVGFPGVSDGKESSCNAGELDWEDPLEKEMATHSSILAWRIPMDGGEWRATVHGVAKSWTGLSD